jgi:hypothetical protein
VNPATFNIRFNFPVDAAPLNVLLEAEVRVNTSTAFYQVTNFRIPGHSAGSILPPISIRNYKGQWVHTDSGKPSELSQAVGEAILAAEARPSSQQKYDPYHE